MNDQNIEKIDEGAHVIRTIVLFRDLKIVDRYYEGKITRFLMSIENIFAKQLKSQEHIIESFKQGDFLRIKTSLTKFKS